MAFYHRIHQSKINKTGLQPVLRLVELAHIFGGWVANRQTGLQKHRKTLLDPRKSENRQKSIWTNFKVHAAPESWSKYKTVA